MFFRDKLAVEEQLLRFRQPGQGRLVTVLRTAPIIGPSVENFLTRYLRQARVPTVLGFDPLLHLDNTMRESDRLIGPFSAVWYVVFMIPFFLFVPDARAGARPPEASGRSATAELWDTTMDPARRMLMRVEVEDAAEADRIFSMLMGDQVEPRREFIEQNAQDVRFLDV